MAKLAPKAAKAESDSGLLAAHKGPVLSVETLGPRRIAVGKESTYEVCMVNSGEVAAEELVVFVSLPAWAEVAGAEPSRGAVEGNAPGEAASVLRWKLGHLDAKGRERMTLRIIPRQNKPFDLAVRWEYKPVASEAMIEVQEPKLALQLEGPREIFYGKKETYQLKLTNLGNGGAENVTIMLMPIGGGENVPATHKIGMLAAGEEKVLDVELTARQSGNLTIQADARADGGVHAELAEKVLVRRAGLKIDVEGPKVQFVGAAVTYAVRVRNTGTAPARNVNLSIALPIGAKYLAGIEDARPDASGSKLQWTIESLNPEAQQVFALKCSLGAAGMSRVQVDATADDDLTASANTVTRVESVANLTMDVKDPQGPVPVGEEVTYEVRVRNRGTKEADGRGSVRLLLPRHRADGSRWRPEPPGARTGDLRAYPLAGARRRSDSQGPRPSRGCRKPHLPSGSTLPAAGRTTDQRGHESVLCRHFRGPTDGGRARQRMARARCHAYGQPFHAGTTDAHAAAELAKR